MLKQTQLFFLSILLIAFTGATFANEMSCHIHPPLKNENDKPRIIGPYPTQQSCDKGRLEMFGNKGRCHCSFDGMPRLNQPSLPFGGEGMGEGFRP